MDKRLYELLEKALQSGEIGSLFIGQGRRMRQVFLAGNEVHLVEAGREIRFCPLPFVIDGSVVPRGELDIVLGRFGASPKSLANLLDEDYDITLEQKATLQRTEIVEETLHVLETGRDRFVFEPGTVPEEVLLPEETATAGIPTEEFLEALRRRRKDELLVATIFPHPEEMPVLSGEGSAKRTDPKSWLFGRVADLVDGFRDLRRIEKDSLFTPHLTRKVLAASVRKGWVRKKRFPEFEGIPLQRLNAEQLEEHAARLEASIPFAVDEIPLRTMLAQVLERRGEPQRLLAHWIALGDMQVGRKDWADAATSYRKAVSLSPGSPEACGRLANLLEYFADESLARGDAAGARAQLEEALPLRAHDESIHLRIATSYAEDDQGASRVATRLAGMLHQENQGDRALRFLRLVIQAYPTSDLVRRSFINFLLDHGMAEEALRELETLARELLARGHPEDARGIFEKILKIDPDRVPPELRAKLRARPTRPQAAANRPTRNQRARRAKRRRAWLAVTLALVGLFGYQFWLWQQAGEIEQKAHALESELTPRVGTQEHIDLRNSWREVLEEIDLLRLRHPVQVATLRFGEDLDEWLSRLQKLELQAKEHLDTLIARARLAEIQGTIDEARRIYQELARVAGDDRWGLIARERLEELEGTQESANALRSRAEEARRAGNRSETFRLLRELVDEYPSAEASAGVRLPVRIVTSPPGAGIEIGDQYVGDAPLVVDLLPYKRVVIRAYQPGHVEAVLEVKDPREAEIHIELERAPPGDDSSVGLRFPRSVEGASPPPRPWAPLYWVQGPAMSTMRP